MATVLGNVIDFMARLGVYDVLLPFLLTFALVFAILEKTRVLGTEKLGKEDIPRRNLNSLIAFCIAFFVVASAQIVIIINRAVGHIVILLLMAVFFLMLIGVFFRQNEDVVLTGKWRLGAMIVMLIGILLIFANAFTTRSGVSWLEYGWSYLTTHWDNTIVATIAFLIVLIIGVVFITRERGSGDAKPADKK